MLSLLRPMVFSVLAPALILFAAQDKKVQKPQVVSKTAPAKNGPNGGGAGNGAQVPAAKTSDSDVIKVTITSSLPTVTTDQSSYGVNGYLKNVSSSDVVVYSKETVLVVQPELTTAHDCVFAIWAFFPTELDDTKDLLGRGARVVIPPKQGYPVSWTVTKKNTRDCESKPPEQPTATQEQGSAVPNKEEKSIEGKGTDSPKGQETNTANNSTDTGSRCSWTFCGVGSWLWETANFVPGNYAFTVSGKAYNYNEKDKSEDQQYSTYSETAVLNVGVPQMVVIGFSGLGGLLAYLVVLFFPGRKELGDSRDGAAFFIFPWWFGEKLPSSIFRKAFSAVLTSALFTIVSSRLSAAESAFPIKVTVTDIWGAITFGFIAYFLGGRFINWLKKFSEGDPNKPDPGAPDPNKLVGKQPPNQKNGGDGKTIQQQPERENLANQDPGNLGRPD